MEKGKTLITRSFVLKANVYVSTSSSYISTIYLLPISFGFFFGAEEISSDFLMASNASSLRFQIKICPDLLH
jgi:hypothetical protein